MKGNNDVKCLSCYRGVQDATPDLEVMVESARTMCSHGVSRPAYFGSHSHSLALNIYVTLQAWVMEGDYSSDLCTHRVIYTMYNGSCVGLVWNKGMPVLGWNLCDKTSTAVSNAGDMQVGKVINFHSVRTLEEIFGV